MRSNKTHFPQECLDVYLCVLSEGRAVNLFTQRNDVCSLLEPQDSCGDDVCAGEFTLMFVDCVFI